LQSKTRKLRGLDLFSGIGGITRGLSKWSEPVAYCERDEYAQMVLLSRMENGDIPNAPIWNDINTLNANMLPEVEFVYGGFPCQDISCAGRGEGLYGERSGLYFQLLRLVEEVKPEFVFLENVPAIRTRGLYSVVKSLTDLRYDCRWTCVSAREVGANHLRKRWFLLAYSNCINSRNEWEKEMPKNRELDKWKTFSRNNGQKQHLANSVSVGLSLKPECGQPNSKGASLGVMRPGHWGIEPEVGRVVNGLPSRVDRIKSLGNAVVPRQVEKAFEKLIGVLK